MPFEVNIALDDVDREVLTTCANKVRVLSCPQIYRTWPEMLPRLNRLERAGLLFSFVASIHPELKLCGPVVNWSSGEPIPDFSKASYRLRSRWCLPAVATKCFIASRAAGRMFGGHGGRYPRESEETHDIHLASVYLHFRDTAPQLAATWVHEARIKSERKQRRGKLPDAIIDKRRVIEFGGAYKKQKLLAFHKYCESNGFDYEVW